MIYFKKNKYPRFDKFYKIFKKKYFQNRLNIKLNVTKY